MPSVEKCMLKIAHSEDLKLRVGEAIKSEERWESTTRGGVGALEAALEQLMGIHARIDKEREAGEGDLLDDDDYKLVKKYLAGDLGLLTKMVRTMRAQIPGSKFRIEGMGRTLALLDKDIARERGKIRQVEMEEKEEILYQKDLEEREEEAPPEVDLEQAEEATLCPHCELTPVVAGDEVCPPCTLYRNRYEKLPPPHVLKARRERQEERSANS